MSSQNGVSWVQLEAIATDNPYIDGVLKGLLVHDYDSFLDHLYTELDLAITRLEENRELRKNDSEDRLTLDIVDWLKARGFYAEHDSQIGGHVDIVVRKNNYLWLGEAKIRRGNSNLWDGFLQLCTRYATGDTNQKEGGLLIYAREPNTSHQMNTWEEHLKSKALPEYSSAPCPKRSLSFFSVHNLEMSGQEFRVRHMPVMLYFEPKDKSGRNRKG